MHCWKKKSYSSLYIHRKDWCRSWSSNTLAIWCKELTHWKRPWCWETLTAGGEGDNRGWDGWMASPMWWPWVWVGSGSWWWDREAWACCSLQGCKELDMTEWWNWTELNGKTQGRLKFPNGVEDEQIIFCKEAKNRWGIWKQYGETKRTQLWLQTWWV